MLNQSNGSKILIIDDDATAVKVLEQGLAQRGYQCQHENSPVRGLALLDAYTPDLVLLDKMMPGMTGQAVLQSIRQKKSQLELPVIMLTGRDQPDDFIESLAAGANDYLTKPVNFPVATARIDTQLQLARLYRDSLKSRELFAVNAMIVTYNHEINNPLMIAMGWLEHLKISAPELEIGQISAALTRIQQIVIKIREAADHGPRFEEYVGKSAHMLKIR